MISDHDNVVTDTAECSVLQAAEIFDEAWTGLPIFDFGDTAVLVGGEPISMVLWYSIPQAKLIEGRVVVRLW